MTTYLVTYTAQYEITADSEDQALSLAIEEHEEMPDGIWETAQVYKTTYTITERNWNEQQNKTGANQGRPKGNAQIRLQAN